MILIACQVNNYINSALEVAIKKK